MGAHAWFPEIVFRKVYVCLYVCMFVCIYCICLSFYTHVSKPFSWSLKAACIQSIKVKESLYYTHAEVSSPSKACFFRNRKLGVATICRLLSQRLFRHPTTEKQHTRPHGSSGNAYLFFVKWAWPVLTQTIVYANKNEEQLKGFAERIF